MTIDTASVYTGIALTLFVWLVLCIGSYRALRLQHSMHGLCWWLPATVGAISTLLAYQLLPLVSDRYTHIADIVVTIGVLFSVLLGLILTKISNVLLARAYRAGTDLRGSRS